MLYPPFRVGCCSYDTLRADCGGMGHVFLSYAREDFNRARTVADALGKAGLSVWWDKHISGGSEYSREIEQALKSAAAVVVLWSRASVDSSWVRDEAAKGRDSGRLIPATLDGTEPPLGFGQFHTIDLSRRGRSAGLRELCEAAGTRSAVAAGTPQPPRTGPTGRKLWQRPAVLATAALLILAAAVGAWLYSSRMSGPDQQPVLAVMPFADMSAARDQAPLAEGIAEQIMTLVSGTRGVRVIGRSSAWQLADKEIQELRDKLAATHLLEGSIRSAGDEFTIAARLITTDTGEEVWSEEFRAPLAEVFGVQEAIGSSVAERLRGTFGALSEGQKARSIRTSPEVYKLYLNARAVGRRRDYKSQLEARQLLGQALAADPRYAPAHAFLAITIEMIDNFHPSGPDQNRPEEVEAALRHARTAIKLAPDHAEGHVAIGMILDDMDGSAALAAMEKGKQLDPANYYAWNVSGSILYSDCRFREAAENYRRAAEVEPLLFVAYQNLIDLLSELGRDDEARQLAARFAATRADPPRAAELGGVVNYWTGNLAESYRGYQAGVAGGSTGPFLQISLAYLYNLLDRPEQAQAALPDAYRSILAAYWRGDYEAAATQGAALGDDMWNIWNLPQTQGKALVHVGRGDEFVSLFDRRWKGFDQYVRKQKCGLYLIGPTLALALRQTGRDAEAALVASATAAEYRMRVKNGLAADWAPAEHAAILMLQGRREQALAELERAVARGWVNQGEPFWVGLNDPVFAPLAAEPRFRALKDRLAATLAKHAAAVRQLEEAKTKASD